MNIKIIIKKILFYFNIYVFKSNSSKVSEFLKKIKIFDTGHKLVSIGDSECDGTYLIPDVLDDIKYCFSPGVGESTIFENCLKKRDIKCFLADGTITKENISNINFDFINKNINTFTDDKNIKIEDWINLKIKNKNEQKNLLLQMDIEGCEYEVLLDLDKDILQKFKILVIEFHDFYNLGSQAGADLFLNIFNKILNDFYICHIHPNNCCGYTYINKTLIPQVMEFTFINKNDVKKVDKLKYKLPHDLDIKNVKNLNDLKLPNIFYT